MLKRCSFVFTDDGHTLRCDGENQGFTVMEILGAFEMKKADLYRQLNYPTEFTRTVKHPDGRVEIIEEKEK